MADFQKQLEPTQSAPSGVPAPRTNTGSFLGDVVGVAGFAANLINQRKAQEANAQAVSLKNANTAEFNKGALQAQKDLAQISQLSGTKQSLAKRRLQQKAMSDFSPTALQGYLEVNRGSGIRLAVAEEQEAVQAQEQAEVKAMFQLEEEGRNIVTATFADSSPEAKGLLEKYGQDGFSSEELVEVARINRGRKQIAQRQAAQSDAQAKAFGASQTKLGTETQAKVNEELLGIKVQLDVAANLLSSTLVAKNPADVITAKDHYKREVIKGQNKFTKFLQTLTREEQAAYDINKGLDTFGTLVSQSTTIVNSIDPVKTSGDLVKLAATETTLGLIISGDSDAASVGIPLAMGVSPDPAYFSQVLKKLVDSGEGLPAFTALARKMTGMVQGNIDPNSETDQLASDVVLKSNAPLTDKAVPAGKYVLLNPEQSDVHNPLMFNVQLSLQESISKDKEATQRFIDVIKEQGGDPLQSMYAQHVSVIRNSMWPSLKKFGITRGQARFDVRGNRVGFETNTRVQEGAFSQGVSADSTARKHLNKASTMLTRMAETTSKLTGEPLSKVLALYAESVNTFLLTDEQKKNAADKVRENGKD